MLGEDSGSKVTGVCYLECCGVWVDWSTTSLTWLPVDCGWWGKGVGGGVLVGVSMYTVTGISCSK